MLLLKRSQRSVASTAVTTIPRAEKTGHFKAVTGAVVTSIDVDAQGRASGVTYVQQGEEFFQPAKVVLLSSFCYENSRLLLLSTSKAFPKGLSNNHGQVGRHYFSHHQVATVTALFPFDLGAWYGLPAQGVPVDDFADDNFDHGALDYKECVGEDLKSKFGVPFTKLAKVKPNETVVFSWIVYKSRKDRDRVMAEVMKDKRLANMMDPKKMPFDAKRMIFGGFKTIVEF